MTNNWYMAERNSRPRNRMPDEQREDGFKKIAEIVERQPVETIAATMGVTISMVKKWVKKTNGMDTVNYRKLKRLHAAIIGGSQ